MDNYFIDNNSEELNQSDQQIFDDITEKFVPRRKAIINDELELSLLRSKIVKSKWEEQKLKIV